MHLLKCYINKIPYLILVTQNLNAYQHVCKKGQNQSSKHKSLITDSKIFFFQFTILILKATTLHIYTENTTLTNNNV